MRTLPQRRQCHRCRKMERSHAFASAVYDSALGYSLEPPAQHATAIALGKGKTVHVCAECVAELLREADTRETIEGTIVATREAEIIVSENHTGTA